jgi:uncharacterized membrane protein YkvA (DUF1232 family)
MGLFSFLAVLALCGTALAIAMLWLVNMPRSPLRDLLVQVVGWLFAIFCAIYCISPIDVLPEAILGPFGLVDDVGAAAVGLMSAMAAYRAGRPATSAKSASSDQ